MARGGRRDGAGAPVGNANALKTGEYSLASRLMRMSDKSKAAFRRVVREAEKTGMTKKDATRLRTLLKNGGK